MESARQYIRLFFVIAVLSLPTSAALLYHHVTKDPFFRPLGITKEQLASVAGQTEFVSIAVHVDWGGERAGGTTRAELRKLISDTLYTRTDDYFFKFRDVPGKRIGVTFVVGPNRYGPYPPARLIDGIGPALAALKMTKKGRR